MWRPALVTAFAAVGITVACDLPTYSCAGVGYWALDITIADAQGNPQALGAIVTLYDGDYREENITTWDPLNVMAAEERGGRTYDVHVTKTFYEDVWIRGVETRGGGCVTGHENPPVMTTLPIVLKLKVGAPQVRSLFLLPPHVLLDRGSALWTPTAYLDANPGVSRALTWRVVGDTSSVTLEGSTGTLRYRCLPTSGYLKLVAQSVADPTVVAMTDVAVQGHPAATNDPPCP